VNDQGVGAGYNHKVPCSSDWPYQSINYSVSTAIATISNKRLAWGADWGSTGNSSFTTINGYAASGWPKVSYSVFIALDRHSVSPTQALSKQAKTISMSTLSVIAGIGSVRTTGIAGVGRSETMTYSPVGYSPVYGTWEVNASAANSVNLSLAVSGSAPSTLDAPILVVHGYTGPATPTHLLIDGAEMAAGTDYFVSYNSGAQELWVTLNKKFSGTHTIQISN
jgi:hypothetical protein